MAEMQFVKHIPSGVKAVVGVWAIIFAMYLFMKPIPEIYQDKDSQLQPKITFDWKEIKSKQSTDPLVRRKDECHILPLNRNSCSKLPNFFLHKDKREDFQDAIISFWHIQKTGGSSMEMCLKAMYEKLNYPSPFSSMARCIDLSKVLDDVTCVTNMTYRPVVHGHYSLGVCDFIRKEITDRKCSVFTIFREPFERAVSHYFFHRQYADRDPNLRDTLELPINEWVKKFGSIVWHSFLFPDWTVTTEGNGRKKCNERFNDTIAKTPWPQNEYLMNEILNNLDTQLSFVGLFEDQSTTYKMLQEVYHLPFYDVCLNIHGKEGLYEGLNATSQRELKKEAKETLMKDDELQELMKFDVRIYEKAKEIFYAQKKTFENMKN